MSEENKEVASHEETSVEQALAELEGLEQALNLQKGLPNPPPDAPNPPQQHHHQEHQQAVVTDDMLAADAEEETTNKEELPVAPNPKKWVQKGATVVVEKGDDFQVMAATLLLDFRGGNDYRKARATREALFQRVVDGEALSSDDRTLLDYVEKYIKSYDQFKEQFERNARLAERDKELLVSVLEAHLEHTKKEISPTVLVFMIVGITLLSNFYTAFSAAPTYNPPVA